ncbi:MAG: ABC transporter ATP-binding protein, partial [Micromonosporaceae bacterium]
VGRPAFAMLDEPTTGLDVSARQELWDALRACHRTGTTILLTSHYLEEVEALAERVVVMDAGRVLAADSLSAVMSRVRVRLVSFATSAPFDPDPLPGVARAEHDRGRHLLYVTDSDELVRALVKQPIPFQDLQVRGASLEEAFQALVNEPGERRPEPTAPEGVPA